METSPTDPSLPRFIPLPGYRELTPGETAHRAESFYEEMNRRRTVRHFSDRAVPRAVIEACIRAAGTSPSGANLQPWHFVAVSDPEIKRRIREEAERQEREFYDRRASREWLAALAPLGTDAQKPYLETAPWLIVVFQRRYGLLPDGRRIRYYYTNESTGIATGILVTAVHLAGLVSLTHTPSPMRFLNEILDRPAHESPFLILVVGYPAADAVVPDIRRKPLEEIATFR
jgi:nitroreductase